MTKLLSIYDVICPRCGQPVGKLCITPLGRERSHPHETRIGAYRAARDSDTSSEGGST